MLEKLGTPNMVKVIMAIAMLLCLLPMPYGYYQLVRLGSTIGFGYLASLEKDKNEKLMWIYIGLAILFQPIIKIALGRTLWNVVDVVVVGWLLLSVYNGKSKRL